MTRVCFTGLFGTLARRLLLVNCIAFTRRRLLLPVLLVHRLLVWRLLVCRGLPSLLIHLGLPLA